MLRIACCLVCCLLGSAATAEDGGFARDQLVDPVVCAADPEQSYALYLPPDYDPERSWPVVFGFSPGARGSSPVRLLMAGAREHGYVLVGSNNSRNGPHEPIMAAQKALWRDVHERFNIDPKRSYAAGFSGGARVSLHMALAHPDRFAGIISCGAFGGRHADPADAPHLAHYVVIGTKDYNWQELDKAERILSGLDGPYWLDEWQGGEHRWPTPDSAKRAMDFLQLAAMQQELIERDEAFIAQQRRAALTEADAHFADGQTLAGLHLLRQVARVFDDDDVAARADDIAAQPPLQGSLAERADYLVLLRQSRDLSNRLRYRKTLQDLRALADGDGAYAAHASMMLGQLLRQLNQLGARSLADRQLGTAAWILDLVSEIGGVQQAAYNAACAYALQNKHRQAIELLERAVDQGWADAAHTESDDDLAGLREHKRFQALLERMRQ